VNVELSNVVEKSRPPQPVPVGRGQPNLFGNKVVEGTDPFRVPPSAWIVARESTQQDEDSGEGLYMGATGI